jgi:hypothetical protein
MQNQEVNGILARSVETDTSVEVRISAIGAAQVRGPTEALVQAVVKACDAREPRVRFRAVELLGQWLPVRQDLRARLERTSREDVEPKVRDRARAVL